MTKDYGIDAFKFDAGEVVWLPDDFNFMQEYINPNEFTNKYVKVVSEPTYRDRIEVFFLALSLNIVFNPHAPDRFTPSHARCAKNSGSALTYR